MTALLRHAFRFALGLAVAFGFLFALHAQPPAFSTVDTVKTPPLPAMQPPVAAFRELLKLTPGEREKSLANRPPQNRERLLAKLQEYDAMKPDERELRLRMTELRWYLLSFIELPAEGRTNQLAMVPEADRKLVHDSLQKWDLLTPDEQKEALKYEKTMEEFLSQRVNSAVATSRMAAITPPPLPPDPFKGVDSFMKLPPEQRQRMYASFQRYFDLSDAEKQKILNTLPTVQRLQLANALTFFARLPRTDREHYLDSFDKLSSLNDAERQNFLKNAERWRALAPAERQAWRALINHVPPMPPLPPEVVIPPTFQHPLLQANAQATGQ